MKAPTTALWRAARAAHLPTPGRRFLAALLRSLSTMPA
jgi:hypothetical protein